MYNILSYLTLVLWPQISEIKSIYNNSGRYFRKVKVNLIDFYKVKSKHNQSVETFDRKLNRKQLIRCSIWFIYLLLFIIAELYTYAPGQATLKHNKRNKKKLKL